MAPVIPVSEAMDNAYAPLALASLRAPTVPPVVLAGTPPAAMPAPQATSAQPAQPVHRVTVMALAIPVSEAMDNAPAPLALATLRVPTVPPVVLAGTPPAAALPAHLATSAPIAATSVPLAIMALVIPVSEAMDNAPAPLTLATLRSPTVLPVVPAGTPPGAALPAHPATMARIASTVASPVGTASAIPVSLAMVFATAPWAGPARPAVSAPQVSTLPHPVLPASQDTMAPTAHSAQTPAPPMVFATMG